MALLDRLSGLEQPKIPVHQFWAALIEWNDTASSGITRQNLIDAFGVSLAEETELDWLKGKIDASSNKRDFLHYIHSLFMLAEQGVFGYNTQATVVARINGLP